MIKHKKKHTTRQKETHYETKKTPCFDTSMESVSVWQGQWFLIETEKEKATDAFALKWITRAHSERLFISI